MTETLINIENPVLKVRDLSISYEAGKFAVKDINADIESKAITAIMGPSGCGKSTLLSIIGLLDIPNKGQVLINNESPLDYKDAKLSAFRNKMLGFVFQSFHLINDLSVIENVELPLLYRRISGSERKQKALAALEKVGLSNRINHYPSQLSGGQKQRVAIARAIVGQPEIILADEPTGNLDSHMGNEIMEILQKLNDTEKTTIVMVTHDESLARKTNRLIRLFDGKQVF